MRHPDHDRLADTVQGWFSYSAPAMGYTRERRRFGVYGRNTQVPGGWGNEVLLRDLTPDDVYAFLTDVRAYFAGSPVRIYIDDHATDEALRPALLAAGCSWSDAQTHLAHVGAMPEAAPVPGLTVELVTDVSLEAWVLTKLKSFADSDAAPASADVQREMALRRAEMAGEGRFRLARIQGEPAAILGWYEDTDRFIFNLATRVPFRMRGIARKLLCDFLAESYAHGCRSIIINADPEGTSVQLYRRLGFTDEVYWRGKYTLHAIEV